MCEFCELYNFLKEDAKTRKNNKGIVTVFKIVLREIRVKNGMEKGTINCRAMDFAFCPICGRKLSEVSE